MSRRYSLRRRRWRTLGGTPPLSGFSGGVPRIENRVISVKSVRGASTVADDLAECLEHARRQLRAIDTLILEVIARLEAPPPKPETGSRRR
jgi:hypothetical protein